MRVNADLDRFAEAFHAIAGGHEPATQGLNIRNLSISEAYQVQQLAIDRRGAEAARCVGYKVGCTSMAIREQFGLDEPISGQLLAAQVYRGDTQIAADALISAAVEPEFVLTMKCDLPQAPPTDEELIDAIAEVAPGIELHQYRFHFGEPSLQELIASNGINAGIIVSGESVSPEVIDWTMEGIGVFRNGALVTSGIAAEIQGGPLHSLRWLIAHLQRRGRELKAGDMVIPGSAVGLVRVEADQCITARFANAGEVSAQFTH